MTLTAHDRAAYRIALHALRAYIVGDDEAPDPDEPIFIKAMLTAWVCGERFYLDSRMSRARMALVLRATLRADAGDCGPLRCDVCGESKGLRHDITGEPERYGDRCVRCWRRSRRDVGPGVLRRLPIRPLWECAPPTRAR